MLDEQATQVVPISGFGLLLLLFWYVALHLKSLIIIIISLFQEDNIFDTNANIWFWITKVEMTLAIEHA